MFKGVQVIEYDGQEKHLELYVCGCCKGHQTYIFKGHKLTDTNYNEVLKK